MKFTHDQIHEIYNCITGVDTQFIQAMAKAAIATAVDIQKDMFVDAELTDPVPGNEDLRGQATGFVEDMVMEFRTALLKEIKEVKFDAHVRSHRVLRTKLEFLD